MRYRGNNSVGVFPFCRIPFCWIPFRQIPFRRMPCKLFFPSFSFLIPFINAMQPFYGCQRNARKNITVTVSVRVIVTVRVSLVWRHRHFLFRKISKWHGFSANLDSAKWDSAKRDSANWDSAKWDSAKWGITILSWQMNEQTTIQTNGQTDERISRRHYQVIKA